MTQEEKTEKTSKRSGVSRREFITGTVGGVVVGAVVGAAAGSLGFPKTVTQYQTETQTTTTTSVTTAQPWLPAKWDQTADVVVVGYGGAGAITAITAFDDGANVLILEKTPSLASLGVSNPPFSGGGGNTCMCAGNAIYASDPVKGATWFFTAGAGNTPMENCQAVAQKETENPAWCTKMGIKFTGGTGTPAATGAAVPELPLVSGYDGISAMSVVSGQQFFTELDTLVQTRKIPVLFSTPATDLIQNPNTKEILGVKALQNGSQVLNIRANKAVVLTTGSIEFNEAMKSDNFRPYPSHYYGWQFCTGDSVTMASKVGAAMWHMGVRDDHCVPWFPEYANAFSMSRTPPGIYINRNGVRYVNEDLTATINFDLEQMDYDIMKNQYTAVPMFFIFDETSRKAGGIASGRKTYLPDQIDPRPVWSSDNSAEIARGWIQQGQDIPSLVKAINAKTYIGIDPKINSTSPAATATVNIDPNVLQATVNAWNAMVTAGKGDTVFGRAATSMKPITTAPFYSMVIWPGGPSAYGGPRRNAKNQVCDINGNPIPRLYSAGENGSEDGFMGLGANLGQSMAGGRTAGDNAAAEKSWS